MDNANEIRFAAEMTLGKLAKWLRILGFDTFYAPNVSGEKLIDIGKGRILLTRTKRIRDMKTAQERIFITSNNPFDQLREVVQTLGLTMKDIHPFSRCIRCNLPIRTVEKKVVRGMVPDHVWETQEVFHTCSRCRRIYWPGSHAHRSRDRIKRLFQ
jgi:uncharacterized protein with PIN domain